MICGVTDFMATIVQLRPLGHLTSSSTEAMAAANRPVRSPTLLDELDEWYPLTLAPGWA